MLSRLSVENYALIEKLDMELSPGLNIVTGETGAGKSILLGALGLILGNRADAAVLKDAGRNCVVEGTFAVSGDGLEDFFALNDIEYEPQSVIRRIITPAGKSRAYVNDQPVQLQTLKELSLRLIDIHSQHSSRMLSDPGFRTGTLDNVALSPELLADYRSVYRELREAEGKLGRLTSVAEVLRRDEEYLRYQFEQIEALKLVEGEQEELEAQHKELANAQQIIEALGHVEELLDREDTGVLTELKSASQSLRGISNVYAPGAGLSERIQGVYLEMKDIASEIGGEKDRVEYNPTRLAEVDERLGNIYSLQQKHRMSSVEELIEFRNELATKLNNISSDAEEIAKLGRVIAGLQEKALKKAASLTSSRVKAAKALDAGMKIILGKLGMPSAVFRSEISPSTELTSGGGDEVTFMFDANGKGNLQPLEKVASGGEISRVMLAMKSLVARGSKLPTIVFDEIDTGVSGRIADATGEIIAELASVMQVVNITHLPQVASKGETHFLVYKEGDGLLARTVIKKLSAGERVIEIAKMLSGSSVTDAALKQAETLLGL